MTDSTGVRNETTPHVDAAREPALSRAIQASRPGRRALLGVLAMSISAVVALLMAEGLLRAVPIVEEVKHRPDPWVGHRLIENFDGWHVNRGDGGKHRLKVSSQGFRDREYPLEKPAGARRILLLGDSYCEAAHVELEASFHERLEQSLNSEQNAGASAPAYEIINTGVSGYGDDNMLLLWRHVGREYRPDLVLMTFVTNDWEDNSRALQQRTGQVEQEPWFSLEGDALTPHDYPYERPADGGRQWLQRHSRVYRLLWTLRFARQRQQRAERVGLPYQFPIHLAEYDAEQEEAWRLTAALIRQIREEVAAEGAKLALVMVSCSWQVHPAHLKSFEERYPGMAEERWDWEHPNRRVRQICAELEIPLLDLLPAFRRDAEANGEELHFPGGHWNARGHALAAVELERFLAEHEAELFAAEATTP